MNIFILTHLLSPLQLPTLSMSGDDTREGHNQKVKNKWGNKPSHVTGSKPIHRGSECSATFCKRNLVFSAQWACEKASIACWCFSQMYSAGKRKTEKDTKWPSHLRKCSNRIALTHGGRKTCIPGTCCCISSETANET